MAVTIRKKEGENTSSFLYRANRRIQKSGVLLEARRFRFRKRSESKSKQKVRAMHRVEMEKLIGKFLKLGYPLSEAVALARKANKGIMRK